ncbi:MAG: peptidoglycan-associated lipoprotein Pal [Arsenophonus sp.]|nr:MAG: peptidoglycan-associated lipoprotein Pal [Arsenophonus sp.]
MKLNKKFQRLLLILPILFVVGCNSKKSSEQVPGENAVNDSNSNLMTEQLENQQMQELQNNNTVYFGFDKYDLLPEYEQILDQDVAFLNSNPSVNVTIEGHTDERGTSEYNIALGERRANAVKSYLESKGVNSEQISIVSYGKEKPVMLGHDESAYSKNRRAVLVY